MRSFDLINAMGELDDETILSAREASAKTRPSRHRIPRGALLAAVLAAVLSIGAVAYYAVSHANTAALMEADPMTNGQTQVVIDETGRNIIDNATVELGLSQTSNGTTVTAESLMGFTDPTQSLLYLTFTVTPPEEYEFPDDMSYWCFWNIRYAAVPDDIQLPRAEATVKNPDGTASVLWMISPFGATAGHRLHIELGGFGMASKEVCADLYSGARTIELPGAWSFDFEIPELPATQEVAFDAAACRAAGLPMTALRLNPFGGILELEGTTETFIQPRVVTLEYPDGTEYTVSFGEYGDNLWINWDEQGKPYCEIVFKNPQPISEAAAILIDGVRIPLQ